MKIKTDFVTNSSSTAYVVIVPNDFHTNDTEICEVDEHCQIEMDYKHDIASKVLSEEISDCLELLKEGSSVDRDYSMPIYEIVLELCTVHDFILTSISMNGGDGNNLLQGIQEEQIEKVVVNNIDIMSVFNLIKRKGNNVTTKTA